LNLFNCGCVDARLLANATRAILEGAAPKIAHLLNFQMDNTKSKSGVKPEIVHLSSPAVLQPSYCIVSASLFHH